MSAIVDFFASFQDGLARDVARAIRLCLAGFATLWLALFGLLIYFTAPVIAQEWPSLFTGQLSSFTDATLGYAYALYPVTIPTALVVLGMWPYISWFPTRSSRAFARALLNAIAARDGAVTRTLVPTAASEAEASGPVTLTGLAHPVGMPDTNWGPVTISYGCVILVIWEFQGFQTIHDAHFDILFFDILFTVSQLSSSIFWITMALLMIAFGAIFWRFHHIARHGFTFTVDDEGLTVRRARGRPHERRILWSDARGFAQVIYYQHSALPQYAYILDGGSERFIWIAPAIPAEGEKDHSGLAWEQRDSARRLVALVERHTSLPLLDISDAVNAALGGWIGNGPQWSVAERALSVALSSGDRETARALLARLRPAGPFSRIPRGLARLAIWRSVRRLGPDARERLLNTARALLPYYPFPAKPDAPVPQPLPPARRFLTASWLTLRQVALVALVVACLFPLWSGLTPTIINPLYSHALETAAPARVLSEQPLYSAALDTPTPGWQTRSASQTDLRSARFTPQGYELSLRQTPTLVQSNIEWNPSIQMPANGAIMITVTVSPAVGGGGDNGAQETTAGVLLDGNTSGTHGTLFDVDSYGDWTLSRCDNLSSPDLACSDILAMAYGFNFNNGPLAPRPGGTTTFHLLLIRQGRTYLLYANGAFLAAYHDDAGPAAPSGAIGLYLDAFGLTAQFTDLAVYPVPDGMPFWAW